MSENKHRNQLRSRDFHDIIMDMPQFMASDPDTVTNWSTYEPRNDYKTEYPIHIQGFGSC